MNKLIEPGDRPHMYCAKCRVDVVIPAALEESSSRFAGVVRQDCVQAMRAAESEFGLGPRESKALVLHVTRQKGKCNRCGQPVGPGKSVCACRSLALDW